MCSIFRADRQTWPGFLGSCVPAAAALLRSCSSISSPYSTVALRCTAQMSPACINRVPRRRQSCLGFSRIPSVPTAHRAVLGCPWLSGSPACRQARQPPRVNAPWPTSQVTLTSSSSVLFCGVSPGVFFLVFFFGILSTRPPASLLLSPDGTDTIRSTSDISELY